MTDYSLSWTCADCGTQNDRPLTKIEAAFCEALKISRALRCRQCGGGNVKSSGNSLPDASDPDVLQAWLSNKKLYFLQQDEELILAGIDARRLVELLTDPATPRARLGLLLLGLIHKVYAGKYTATEEEQVAKEYLRQNLAAWKDAKAVRLQIRKVVLESLRNA